MKYENAMYIIYDVLKKSVLVEFREGVVLSGGPILTQRDAIGAGENLCRTLGWVPEQRRTEPSSMSNMRNLNPL